MTIFNIDFQLFISVCAGLFFFSWGFNYWVGKIGERKRGYTALLVVVGVMTTLGGVALWDWRSAALAAVAFIFSGIPMIAGDIARYQQEQAALIQDLLTDD
jgi:hypothetical protein